MAPFVGNGYTIVIVGDSDIFMAFKGGLRACPARVFSNLQDKNGNKLPGEMVYLRDINKNMSAFCTVKTKGQNPSLSGAEMVCDADAVTWLNTRVYFLTFVMAGNWMQAWSHKMKGAQTSGKKPAKVNMKKSIRLTDKLLLIIDEAHKLGILFRRSHYRQWKGSAALFPKFLANLGEDNSTNLFVVAGTATVNTTKILH